MSIPSWYERLTVASMKSYVLGKMTSSKVTFELEESDWDQIAYTALNKYNNYKPNVKRTTLSVLSGVQSYTLTEIGQGIREFFFPIPNRLVSNVENPFYLDYATRSVGLGMMSGGPATLIALDQWLEAMRNATGQDIQVDLFGKQLRISPTPSASYDIEYEYLDDHILGEESVKASLTIQDLKYEGMTGGVTGNDISITYTGGGTAGSESVAVNGNDIVVTIESAVSTATQIKTAVDNDTNAAALVSVIVTGTGSNAQTTQTKTNLSGGVDEIETTVYPIDRDSFLDLALAYAKIKVGEMRRKHSEVSTGTVTIRLDTDILREGKEEAKAIEEDLFVTGRRMFIFPMQG